MKLSKEFATDQAAEVAGVWVEYEPGAEFRIARDNNPRYQAELRRLTQPLQHKFRTKTLAPEHAEELVTRAMAVAILVDWRGIEDDQGEPLPYTVEHAYDALTKYPDLRKWVAEQAAELNLFRLEKQKSDADALGNG